MGLAQFIFCSLIQKSKVGHIVIILYLALRLCAVVIVHIAMLEHSLYNFLNYMYISRAIS